MWTNSGWARARPGEPRKSKKSTEPAPPRQPKKRGPSTLPWPQTRHRRSSAIGAAPPISTLGLHRTAHRVPAYQTVAPPGVCFAAGRPAKPKPVKRYRKMSGWQVFSSETRATLKANHDSRSFQEQNRYLGRSPSPVPLRPRMLQSPRPQEPRHVLQRAAIRATQVSSGRRWTRRPRSCGSRRPK